MLAVLATELEFRFRWRGLDTCKDRKMFSVFRMFQL